MVPPAACPEPGNVASLIERARGDRHDGLCSVSLASLEVEAMELEKQDTDHETSWLVAIDKGMVLDNSRRVEGGHFDDPGRTSVGVVLTGPRESGLQRPLIANT
jgi:hypothetical protein